MNAYLRFVPIPLSVVLLLLAACGGTHSVPTDPSPSVTSVSPSAVPIQSPGTRITVSGSNFVARSVVRLDSKDLPTTYVSSTQLAANLSADALSTAKVCQLTVFNPAPGGGESAAVTVEVQNPAPTITSISPGTFTVGEDLELTIIGGNFVSSTTVADVNPAIPINLSVTFISGAELKAVLPLSQFVGTVREVGIEVTNPAPGGGTHKYQPLSLHAKPPQLTKIIPASCVANVPTTVTIEGSGITPMTRVLWNGMSHSLIYISPTSATLQLDVRDVETPSEMSVALMNPEPGGGTSNSATFTILSGGPAISFFEPGVMAPDASAANIVVKGTAFNALSKIRWNRTELPTSFVSPTELHATATADRSGQTSAVLDVVNSGTGGGTSNAATVQIASFGSGEPITVDSAGKIQAGSRPVITPQGRYVLFNSNADLLGLGTGGMRTYSRDRCLGADANCAPDTTVVSIGDDGSDIPGATPVALTADGRYAVFTAGGPYLMRDTCTNASPDCTPTTVSLSRPPGADPDWAYSWKKISVSASGRFMTLSGQLDNSGEAHTYFFDTCLRADSACLPGYTELKPPDVITCSDARISADGASAVVLCPVRYDEWKTKPGVGDHGQGFNTYSRTFLVNTCAGLSADSCTLSPKLASEGYNVEISEASTDARFVALHRQYTHVISIMCSAVCDNTIVVENTTKLFDTCGSSAPGCEPHPIDLEVDLGSGGAVSGLTLSGRLAINGDTVYDLCSNGDASCIPNATTIPRLFNDGVFLLTEDGTMFARDDFSVDYPRDGNSSPALFAGLTGLPPAPALPALATLNEISPPSVAAGSLGFLLTVTGADFSVGSVVQVDGVDRPTVYLDRSHLQFEPFTSDLAIPHSATITVADRIASRTSNAIALGVLIGTPSGISVSPSVIAPQSPATTIRVSGKNFLPTSVIRVDGKDFATTYVSGSQLTASLPADILTAPGVLQITVFTPQTGGGESAPISVKVQNPVPTITSVSPSDVLPRSPATTITVSGKGFLPTSVIRVDGEDFATTYVSSSLLTATLSAESLAVARVFQITVFSPQPGGGVSAAVAFTAGNPVPVITSISPQTYSLGDTELELTILGSEFTDSTTVQNVNSDPPEILPVTFISSTEIKAIVAIPLEESTGFCASIIVSTPPPGGGEAFQRLCFQAN